MPLLFSSPFHKIHIPLVCLLCQDIHIKKCIIQYSSNNVTGIISLFKWSVDSLRSACGVTQCEVWINTQPHTALLTLKFCSIFLVSHRPHTTALVFIILYSRSNHSMCFFCHICHHSCPSLNRLACHMHNLSCHMISKVLFQNMCVSWGCTVWKLPFLWKVL